MMSSSNVSPTITAFEAFVFPCLNALAAAMEWLDPKAMD